MSADQLLKDIRARVVSLEKNPVPGVGVYSAVLHVIDSIMIEDYMPSVLPPSQEPLDTRLRALDEARKRVRELTEEKNDRGYGKHSLSAEAILREERRVARFLLGEED